MDPHLLLKGAALGFAIAAPVGPIGILCIRRTLAEGRWIGFASGLGAAVADTLYGAVAAFGFTAASNLLVSHKLWLHLIGGAFLLYLGVKTFLAEPNERSAEATGRGALGAFLSTFVLTVTNPMTILSFAAVFAGLGLGGTGGGALLMLTGIFAGSAFWWLMLCTGTGHFGKGMSTARLRGINRLSGVAILLFAIAALWSAKG